MHDMRVTLDMHEVDYLYRTWCADSPNIIAPQIYEHQMLCSLFWIRKKLFAQTDIFFERG